MTCKDCLHYEICYAKGTLMYSSLKAGAMTEKVEIKCHYNAFKNKADYAEVVRCPNCIYYGKGGKCQELFDSTGHNLDLAIFDYCSYGIPRERKSEDD